jgi:uncharacterized protein YkwD
MIVGLVHNGAQRASLRSRIAVVIAASLLASAFGFALSAASPGPTLGASRWHDVETYYLKLVNCTRTGGWVRSNGSCDGYGSGSYSKYVKPLSRKSGLSSVARKWAKHLVAANDCAHGNPGARLARAGYHGSAWGENVGCNNYDRAKRAVLGSHLSMQAEKGSGGGHWKNIKNAAFKSVGIGVWRDHGRTRVVTDFYRP